jgi:DsbC/DsbD-like thiol-disulfide interchange protein
MISRSRFMACHLQRMKIFALYINIVFLFFSGNSFELLSASHVKAELVSEVNFIQPGEMFRVAVHLTMAEGWHSYWRNPGDSGLPTEIKWTLPDGIEAGDLHWPYPKKFGSDNIVSYGYEDDLYLLVEMKPSASLTAGSRVKIVATVEWLECNEMCIPGKADLFLELAVKNEAPVLNRKWIRQFEQAGEKLPVSSSNWKISVTGDDQGFIMQLTPPAGFSGSLSNIFFFPQEKKIIDHSSEQQLIRTQTGYLLKMKKSPYVLQLPLQLSGVLVSEAGWYGAGLRKALLVDLPVQYNVNLNE